LIQWPQKIFIIETRRLVEDRGVHWTWRGGELGTERNLKMIKSLAKAITFIALKNLAEN
jgi:hypothetical protein